MKHDPQMRTAQQVEAMTLSQFASSGLVLTIRAQNRVVLWIADNAPAHKIARAQVRHEGAPSFRVPELRKLYAGGVCGGTAALEVVKAVFEWDGAAVQAVLPLDSARSDHG